MVSRLLVNRSGRTVVGVPLSTSYDEKAPQPSHRILIPAREITLEIGYTGEVKTCLAKTDQIRVLDKARLGRKMGRLSNSALIAVGLGMAFLLDLR
jgi:mRNA-degrading endonuclease toxin of MazEF toxin-antitoxin module